MGSDLSTRQTPRASTVFRSALPCRERLEIDMVGDAVIPVSIRAPMQGATRR